MRCRELMCSGFMKPYLLSMAFGVIASASAGVVLAYGVSITAGTLKHPMESWAWFFLTSIGPRLLLPPAILRLRKEMNFKGVDVFCAALLGFFVVALSGSLGAVAVESARRGLAHVNVSGYMDWSFIYALALLPISLPLAALVLHYPWQMMTKK